MGVPYMYSVLPLQASEGRLETVFVVIVVVWFCFSSSAEEIEGL